MTDTEMRSYGGVLVVDKPAGITSLDAVNQVRRLYGTKQVGHTGTLDPMATGVLVILVGRAVKASEYLSSHDKSYSALMRLGITTDTQDVTGKVIRQFEGALPDPGQVSAVCGQFTGMISQIPPMYSALKVGGRKLYDLARHGQTVERAPRDVVIYELSCEQTEFSDSYRLDIRCSGGTYIRTLCDDIGSSLGCGAVMAELRRISCGMFSIGQAYSLNNLSQMTAQQRLDCLLPVSELFADLPSVSLPDFYARLVRNGQAVDTHKLLDCMPDGQDLPAGSRCALYCARGEDQIFFALGEIIPAETGNALKAIKLFAL